MPLSDSLSPRRARRVHRKILVDCLAVFTSGVFRNSRNGIIASKRYGVPQWDVSVYEINDGMPELREYLHDVGKVIR